MFRKTIILSLILVFPFLASASIDTNLKYGNTGAGVTELQEFLISKGFLAGGYATGNFYSLTLAAVKSYQLSVGVPNTGYVGPMTREKINAELSVDLKDSNDEEVAVNPTPSPVPTPAPTPVPTPSPTPVFGNVSAPVTPTYTPVTNVSFGTPICGGVWGVALPITVTGDDWSKIMISYQGYGMTAMHNGISGYALNNPRQIVNQVDMNTRYSAPGGIDSTSTPLVVIQNVPGTYNITGTIYNRAGVVTGVTASQSVMVPNECRTSKDGVAFSDKNAPLIHPDGTYNGQLQSDGTWINTTTTSPFVNSN